MSRIDLEHLLQQLAVLDESVDDLLPPVEILEAFRAGTLSDEDERKLEIFLSSNPGARQRLLELAGVKTQPSPETRRRVLESFSTGRGRPWQRRLWYTFAAVAASLLMFAVLPSLRGPTPLPPGLSYDVAAFGLAETRSLPTGGQRITARPDTVVIIEATPRGAAESDVEFGIYRRRKARLEKITLVEGMSREASRGAVRFKGRAADLVGMDTGTHKLLVAVARPGDLPTKIELVTGIPADIQLADGGRRLVYTQTIEVIPMPDREDHPQDPEERRLP